MELNEDEFLEELLALRRETYPPPEINGLFSATPCQFNALDSTPSTTISPNLTSNDTFTYMEPIITTFDCSTFTDFCIHTSSPILPTEPAFFAYPYAPSSEGAYGTCKAEPAVSEHVRITAGSFDNGFCMERSNASSHNGRISMVSSSSSNSKTSKMKKKDGQPSKNLMAERRRRKRLNDRLSMLRSVVPKISKMDRTSILWDTIEYMKELRDKINKLEEEIDVDSNQLLNVMSIFKDVKPNDVLVRNSPKFDVERRELDTRIEICCAAKPGILLTTLTTLEAALGLEIQHCVISCFNDFSLQASCLEEIEQRNSINSEEIKQALFRNAGYGGRCL